jgi:hypothetical protein
MMTPLAARRVSDDVLVLGALLAIFIACVVFRYLPMVDLPQHYAMVSIMRHHGDPAWGFSQRYMFDFVGRPYATVYFLGYALCWLMPLNAAMRVVVALCTVAPFAGMWALLIAIKRPRAPLLLVMPFAFGSIWHWGFLNFLLGTGLFLGGLALVVRAVESESLRPRWLLGALGPLLLLTHFHGLVMLLLIGPVLALGFVPAAEVRRAIVRGVLPMVPAGVLALLFVLITWRQAEGSWVQMSPPLTERLARFPEFLAGGLGDPWPDAFVAITIAAFIAALFVGDIPLERRARVALIAALAAQILFFLFLPLNTNTATYVSARHALLIALFVVPLFPESEKGAVVARAGFSVVFVLGFVVAVRQLSCFNREASDFDAVVPAMAQNRRVLPLIFARNGACVDPVTFPYLHFAAYYQAAKGGELSRSFAVVWNVPIRYRADYRRYPIREHLEWAPHQVTADDVRHYDYVLTRGTPRLAPNIQVREQLRSGAWTLFEVVDPLSVELPP